MCYCQDQPPAKYSNGSQLPMMRPRCVGTLVTVLTTKAQQPRRELAGSMSTTDIETDHGSRVSL